MSWCKTLFKCLFLDLKVKLLKKWYDLIVKGSMNYVKLYFYPHFSQLERYVHNMTAWIGAIRLTFYFISMGTIDKY